jgi:hypothetical protein
VRILRLLAVVQIDKVKIGQSRKKRKQQVDSIPTGSAVAPGSVLASTATPLPTNLILYQESVKELEMLGMKKEYVPDEFRKPEKW